MNKFVPTALAAALCSAVFAASAAVPVITDGVSKSAALIHADPAMQALFAPFVETPMQPARIGSVSVPSTMVIEIWPGEDARPDFLLPLPDTQPGAPLHQAR